MEPLSDRCCRFAIAVAFVVMVLGAPGQAGADPVVTVFPGMEIDQGSAVCMVGMVEPRLRIALTTGECDDGKSLVTDRDHNAIGAVVLSRRQNLEDAAAGTVSSPVGYEVIALAPGVAANDQLPTGRPLRSEPGMRAEPGMRVCQFRSSAGQRCGLVGSVTASGFVVDDMAFGTCEKRDFGAPVYTLTEDGGALIVGMVEGLWKSSPQIESWQAVMRQVYLDGSSRGPQQTAPTLHPIGG